MANKLQIIQQKEIENRIFTFRKLQVMIDRDLADIYGVETKVLNQTVKRNIERFPDFFRFQLTNIENNELLEHIEMLPNVESQNVTSILPVLRSQIVTLENRGKHRKYLPYVFTEQGIAMLSALIRSETAIEVSIKIMTAFVEMRKMLKGNSELFKRINIIESQQIESNYKFEVIFKALESKEKQAEKGIFFEGQVFDAYAFIAKIIKQAEESIVLIDNYVDETVLTLLTKRKKNTTAIIYTKQISKQLELDLKKYNEQYPPITIKTFGESHDRFLIIDQTQLYHLGASIKDLGKKWFAFSQMNSLTMELLKKLKESQR
jgi:hypothetical protein